LHLNRSKQEEEIGGAGRW